MRLDSALIVLIYVFFKLLQAGRLAQALRAAHKLVRGRRLARVEHDLLRRLERAMVASDGGWTRPL